MPAPEKDKVEPICAPQIAYINGKLQVMKSSLDVYLEKEEKTIKTKRKEKSEKWSLEETEKFYKALQIFGTDFSIIVKLLPGRTRKQIKNKFNKEEKANPEKIDLILKNTGIYTLEDFEKCYGKLDNLLGEEDQFVKEKINLQLESTEKQTEVNDEHKRIDLFKQIIN